MSTARGHGSAESQRRGGVIAAMAMAWCAAPAVTVGYVVVVIIGAGMPVTAAWLTKLILDGLIWPEQHRISVVWLAFALAGTALAALIVPPVSDFLRRTLEREVGVLATDRLFAAVNSFDGLARFEDPMFLDRLRLAADHGGTTPSQVLDSVLGLIRGIVMIGGFAAALVTLSPVVTAAVLLSGAPTIVAEVAMARRRAAMFWQIGPTERLEFAYSSLLSSVEAAKEVRLFGLGTFLRRRMLAERRKANAARRGLDRRELVLQGTLGLLAAAVAGMGLLWAVSAARTGSLTVGDVSMTLAAVTGVQGALTQIAAYLGVAHHQLLLFAHYRAVVRAEPDLPRPPTLRPVPSLRRGIELRDVWFRYSDEHPWTLRGINLYIPHGQSLALVGGNGAGKSTLVKLLCRFYDPTHGAVLWDGVNLRDVDPADLRRRIGAIFQDYMEYEMTAADNIGVGDLAALGDAERIVAASRRAGAHATISALPRGYHTQLSRAFFAGADDDPTAGLVLSGGQWQRVALARMFLRDQRDLLILDEPNSGLDVEAEYEIHRSLQQHRAGATTLLISHRLSAVRDADAIAILEDGRVVEYGSHTELLAADRTYARLFALQAQGYGPRNGPTGARSGCSTEPSVYVISDGDGDAEPPLRDPVGHQGG